MALSGIFTGLGAALASGKRFDPNDPQSWIARAQNIIAQIEDVKQQAHHAEMHEAARALNEAKNKAGWELAGYIERAKKAQT